MKATCMDARLFESLRDTTSLFLAYKLRVHYLTEANFKGTAVIARKLHALGVPVEVAAWLLTPGAPGAPPVSWVPHQPEVIEITPLVHH